MMEPEQLNVEFIGFHDTDSFEKAKAETKAFNTFRKLARIIKHPDTRLSIHVKEHEIEGERRKYSIHSRLVCPGHSFDATHDEWNILTAVEKSLAALEKEVIKKFKR
ncbi:MAG: hypothetical protein Q7K34_01755 [archaeon]|nr:hypothetical protein [archaeon]